MSEPLDFVVAFLQCDRADYTRRTLESFVRCSSESRWEGWYADDASTERRKMRDLAESHGMRPLVLNETRAGCTRTTAMLVGKLMEKYSPETMVLYLQNDFEFIRPLSFGPIRKLLGMRPDIGWVRMAGNWASGHDRGPDSENWIKVGPHNWEDVEVDGEAFEIGRSYFSYNPPPLVPLGAFHGALQGSLKEETTAINLTHTGKLASRFRDDVTVHIGHRRTQDFEI